jgi:hypothetical protein
MCAQTTERESLEKVMNKTNDTEDFDTSSMCFLATTIRRAAVVVRCPRSGRRVRKLYLR